MTAISFRQLSQDYLDGYPPYNFVPQAFPAMWTVINQMKDLGYEAWEKMFLKHLNDSIRLLLEWRRPITQVQRLNTVLYRGKHYIAQDFHSSLMLRRGGSKTMSYDGKVVLNYLGQAADQYVSEMCSYEPALVVRPKNDEESDRVSARMNKMCLDHYFYELELKTRFAPFHLRTKVHGESFKFVKWDPDLGDVYPAFKEMRDRARQAGIDPDAPTPLMDPETGEQLKNDNGDPIFLNRPVKTGDIMVEDEYSERVLYPVPPSCLWSDVPYVHRLLLMDLDEVKARWPKYAEKAREDSLYGDYFGPNKRSLTKLVCVRYTYHKPTTFLEQGFTSYSTEHCILQAGKREFDHDLLPCIRGTDVDVPFELTGMSMFQNLATLNQAMNNSTSSILQNQQQFAYPKFAVPRGAKVKFVNLGDDRGVYEFSGPTAPEILAQNSTPPDTWKWREAMRSEFRTLAMLDGPQSGEAPQGITANVALRMLEEQHRKLRKPSIDKHGRNVEILGKLMLSTLGTYRDPLDGSLISVVGKNNERYLRYFDVANLSKPYSVELQKSSGLPESPAAKTQTVLDLADRFENMWSPDEVLEYLDIPRPEKLVESATMARESAESEVEDIMSGIPVAPPTEYHDILPKYRVYGKAMQSRSFDEADPRIQQSMIQHILTAEYLIIRKMKLNPGFAQIVLQQFPNFPMYFPMEQQGPPPLQLAMPSGTPGLPIPPGTPASQYGTLAVNSPNLGGMPPQAGGGNQPLPPEPSQTPLPGNPPDRPTVPAPGALP